MRRKPVQGVPYQHKYTISISNLVPSRITVSSGSKDGTSRAEALYRVTVSAERRAAQGVAQDYDLPVEAVHEAIDYAMHSKALLEAERTREEARMQLLGLHKPPFFPADTSVDA